MAVDAIHEGSIPFQIRSLATTCHTYYKLIGDLSSSIPPLVVLHGGPGSGHEYCLPYGKLWALYGKPVLFYDQIGCAASTHLREKAGDLSFWNIDLFVAELQNILAYFKLGADAPFDMLGHSWGGIVAANFAAHQPAGLRRLILAGAPASGPLFHQALWRITGGLSSEAQAAIREAVDKREFTSPGYLSARAELVRTYLCRADPPPPELLANLKHQAEDTTVRSTLGGLSPWLDDSYINQSDSIPLLPRINVPTLVTNGEFDTTPEEPTAPFFEHIPKVRWVTFAGGSHMPHLDSAELQARVLKVTGDFLQGSATREMRSSLLEV